MDDEDDWNPSKAAGVCLMLLSNCCENDIVQYVLPFVTKYIKDSDWRFREAAIMAFGTVLKLFKIFIIFRDFFFFVENFIIVFL